MKKCLPLFLSFFILSGCQSTLIKTENNYIELPNSASIEIVEPLNVSPNSARAFLQKGEVIHNNALNLYEVDCEIEINTVSEEPQIVEPGIYKIISVYQDESPIVDYQQKIKPILVASLSYAWASDSPVDIKRYYHYRLSQDLSSKKMEKNSDTQVRAMICRGAQAEPYRAELPTYEQMKTAVGPYIKFGF